MTLYITGSVQAQYYSRSDRCLTKFDLLWKRWSAGRTRAITTLSGSNNNRPNLDKCSIQERSWGRPLLPKIQLGHHTQELPRYNKHGHDLLGPKSRLYPNYGGSPIDSTARSHYSLNGSLDSMNYSCIITIPISFTIFRLHNHALGWLFGGSCWLFREDTIMKKARVPACVVTSHDSSQPTSLSCSLFSLFWGKKWENRSWPTANARVPPQSKVQCRDPPLRLDRSKSDCKILHAGFFQASWGGLCILRACLGFAYFVHGTWARFEHDTLDKISRQFYRGLTWCNWKSTCVINLTNNAC